MITRPKSCITPEGYVAKKALESVLTEHGKTAEEMSKMRDYYDGEHDIKSRHRSSGLPNNKLVHAFPRYITTMASGYLIGSPVSYLVPDDAQKAALQELSDAYDKMNADSVDAELAKHASIYGVGIELAYADEQSNPRTASIDPRGAFVVYDDTVAHAPLFGVQHYKVVNAAGEDDGYRVNVYTAERAYGYNVKSLSAIPTEAPDEVDEHYFGGVPMVEFWNNDEEEGDFRPVISLIDAYNTLQSDRINDKTQFVDALMVLSGASLDDDEDYDPDDETGNKRSAAQRLREDRLIQLPKDAELKYLNKQLNEEDTEVLKDAIKADIHKMSMIPDLTDENFAGNSSGVAMRYKLLGLEQLTKIKERWFREGLQARMRLFSCFLGARGKAVLDADIVQITFKRSLPVNQKEIAEMVSKLHGIVPDKILLEQLDFVSNADSALDMLKEQKQESIANQQALYSQYPDANNPASVKPEEDDTQKPKPKEEA